MTCFARDFKGFLPISVFSLDVSAYAFVRKRKFRLRLSPYLAVPNASVLFIRKKCYLPASVRVAPVIFLRKNGMGDWFLMGTGAAMPP